MTARGYPEARVLRRTFLLEGTSSVVPLDLPIGACSTIVALAGGAVRDLELTLFDEDGEEAASDGVPGEGGLLHVCPMKKTTGSETRPFYLVERARDGSGAAMAALFLSKREPGRGFDQLFEGLVAPRVSLEALEPSLGKLRALLRARGFESKLAPVLKTAAEGDLVRFSTHFDARHCYVVMARGDEGVRDLDLFLYDFDGAEVARDLDGDAAPTIEYCPERVGRYTVELRAFEGAGAVGLLVFEGPDSEGRRRRDTSLREEASDLASPLKGPANAFERSAADVVITAGASWQARGYGRPVPFVPHANIAPGEVQTHEIPGGVRCAVVLGATVSDGTDLDLYLADSSGHAIDKDTSIRPLSKVAFCALEGEPRRVMVKGYGREGTYALSLLPAPETMTSLRALRLEQATAPFRAHGYTVKHTASVTLSTGQRAKQPFVIDAGTRCVAFAAAGDSDVEDVDLFLRDAEGKLVAGESQPDAFAAVSNCPESEAGSAADASSEVSVARSLVLEIAMYRGAGTVTLSRLEVSRSRGGAP